MDLLHVVLLWKEKCNWVRNVSPKFLRSSFAKKYLVEEIIFAEFPMPFIASSAHCKCTLPLVFCPICPSKGLP